ncbi:cytochrome c [Comamonas badia]|uniref:cytochrome c n=1 Tax=Comamonas badia TaxID=265291 RepID=UPI0003FCA6AD|nr:cytochrome c [Comamonas badia]
MHWMKPLAALALALATGAGWAQSAAEPLVLRSVMAQMQADTQAAGDAIARQDWASAASHADKLAHHAEPPALEKVRILTWLLTDAMTFRNYDLQVKSAAAQLRTAAQQQDGVAAARDLARMQQSCDGCHNSYRAKFLAHFYGTP